MYSLYVTECSNSKIQFQTSSGLYTILTALVVPTSLVYRVAGILKVASLKVCHELLEFYELLVIKWKMI